MTNYENFVSCIYEYCALHKMTDINFEHTLSEASLDNSCKQQEPKKFVTKYKDLKNISMDTIAQEIIAAIHYKGSKRWNLNAPASVDSFLIDKNNIWYFIEFKNQKISRAKEKCIEKAFSNLYWLFNMFYELQENEKRTPCKLDNLFRFIKSHCVYYIVIINNADPVGLKKVHDLHLANNFSESVEYNFIAKLNFYIFKDAKVVSEEVFDEIFVKNFEY